MRLGPAYVVMLACFSQSARAADPIAAVEVSQAFKPEFETDDGDGRYSVTALTLGARFKSVSVSAMQAAVRARNAETEQQEVALQDPTLSFSAGMKIKPESLALGLRAGLSYTPAFYEETRSKGYAGSSRASLGLSRALGVVTIGSGAAYTRRFHRYTLNEDGAVNSSHSVSGSGFANVAMGKRVEVGATLAYVKTKYHYGRETYGYSNSASISYAASDNVSFTAAISTSDSQLSPAGDDNNELSLYKRNKTEAQISATVAL